MRNAHIVMLSRSLPFHSLGGMEAVAWDLARQFVVDGVQVTFLTTQIAGKSDPFMADGVKVVPLAGTPPGRYSKAWWAESRSYFRRNLMDSVTGVLSVSAAAYGIISLKPMLPGVPFVFQAHGSSLGEVVSKWRTCQAKAILSSARNIVGMVNDLRVLPSFDAVVAVGGGVFSDLRRPPLSWVLSGAKTCLIKNGINTHLFCPDEGGRKKIRSLLGWGQEERVVVSASRLHGQKGVDLGIRAFAEYAQQDSFARYLIVGDGPEKAALLQLAQELGTAEKVVFVGGVERGEVPDYLRAGDTFLLTTIHQEVGITLSVLEALAVGLPVVVSQHLNGVNEIGQVVIGVKPTDTKSVANALSDSLRRGRSDRCLLPESLTLTKCAHRYYGVLGV